MCASEDNTRGSAKRKMAGHVSRLMKEGCQEGYQQGVARRMRQSCGVTDRQLGGGRIIRAETDRTNKTAGSNFGANNPCRTVTESIIYFGTLDTSLRFLGR